MLEKKGKKWKFVVAMMTLVITLETGWSSVSQAIEPNKIDPSEAQRFFVEKYFPAALEDPEKALNRWGTPEFRAQKKATGLEGYIAWYRETRAIPARRVGVVRHNEEPAVFDVSMVRIAKDGVAERKVSVFGLEYDDILQVHIPWVKCQAENLRITYNSKVRSL